MERIIEKAAVLIEALPFMQQFKGETVVVKFGGSIMNDKAAIQTILRDVAFMACVGMKPVLVHGGGKAISREMEQSGITPEFVKGLRVTDDASMEVVERVLNHEVNPEMVAVLESYGCKAWGLHGDDMLQVVRHTQEDTETGKTLDWGYVGVVDKVNIEPIKAFLAAGMTPVITPMGRDRDRKIHNVNADEAAAAIAQALRARKLVFLTDVPGVLKDPQDHSSLISSIHVSEIDQYKADGVLSGGMLPKVASIVKALGAGVRKTHIIDSSMPHSLLLELFTEKGVGTEILL